MAQNDQIVIFGLNAQHYALPISNVSEIIRVMEITEVPNMNFFYKGIINLRGSIVPVISSNLRLGLEEHEVNKDSRIIVVEQHGEKLGLTVDSVYAVSQFSPDQVEESDSVSGKDQFIKGVIHQDNSMILLLDLDRMTA